MSKSTVTTHTIIPAAPGWFECAWYKGHQDPWIDEPIIAWEIEREDSPGHNYPGERDVTRRPTPITANPDGSCDHGHWAILGPDGHLYDVFGSRFASKAALIKYWNEQDAELAARVAAPAPPC